MTKSSQLADLRQEILDKNVCSELAKQATQLVMGVGSLDAKILFIGEAPGKKEDEQGEPFVGASGKFLNQMIDSIGLIRADVYITNIVKYRPPKNRDPSKAEKAEFWPYLLRQIDIIKPEIIVTLGRHSMNNFLPEAVIGEIHGKLQVVEMEGRSLKIVPLYHPAAALYSGKLKQTLLDDFQKILQILK